MIRFLNNKEIYDTLKKTTENGFNTAFVMVAFIGNNGFGYLPEAWKEAKEVNFIVNLSNNAVCIGATNPKAIKSIQRRPNTYIRANDKLHAKMYIIDKTLILTSANLSGNAFDNNHETALYTDNPKIVKQAKQYFTNLWNSDETYTIENKIDEMINLWEKSKKKRIEFRKLFGGYNRRPSIPLLSLPENEVRLPDNTQARITYFFKIFLKDKIYGVDWAQNELKTKQKDFRKLLSINNLRKNQSREKAELIYNLAWGDARNISKNKFLNNGVDKIFNECENLLYGSGPIEIRFDRFKKRLKWAGPSLPSTLLCLSNPKEFTFWNNITIKAFHILKIRLPKGKGGAKYSAICRYQKEIIQKYTTLKNLFEVDKFMEHIGKKLI